MLESLVTNLVQQPVVCSRNDQQRSSIAGTAGNLVIQNQL
jgi:hypothetical protein